MQGGCKSETGGVESEIRKLGSGWGTGSDPGSGPGNRTGSGDIYRV